ncbi:RagB/SusD family nutrient uptake outer membrane protein [Olivibacter sp. SA151]|uniref:RagB/SusD family nutrient uptake outer membrane protein n=1 Tax=Olivibacter jilunii TaxID=985016 RepID=UPI003F16D8D4
MIIHTRYKTVLIAAFLLAAGLTSCKKMLDEENLSGITDETLYTTPKGFETLVNAAYSYQRWWYGKERGYNIGETGTDLWTNGAGDVYPDLTTYQNLQATNGALQEVWSNFYKAINVCNAGIARVGNSGMDQALQIQRTAEFRFLRAFYYYHIVETWGGVHLTTEETVGVVTEARKSSVDDFYNLIIEDLRFAVDHLAPTTADYGRVTKPAAEAFLARVYLTRGLNAEASALAKKVISDYGFALLPNYADLWRMNNLQNSEIVYAVNYSSNLNDNDKQDDNVYPDGDNRGSNSAHMLFLMKYDDQPGVIRSLEYGRPFNRYQPSRYLLYLFNENIDSRFEASFQNVWYCNQPNASGRPAGMNVGDTAVFISKYTVPASVRATKNYTIYDDGDIYNTDGSSKNRLRYISLKKFMDNTRGSINEAQSVRDAFVIRLAEMYLIVAEAAFKTGNNEEAVTYLNIIRERAAKEGYKEEMDVNAADVTLDFILEERAREFAGEQMRWFDLKRTGKLKESLQKYNPHAITYFRDYHMLRPIPQNQLDAVTNKSEFTQNPGYQ